MGAFLASVSISFLLKNLLLPTVNLVGQGEELQVSCKQNFWVACTWGTPKEVKGIWNRLYKPKDCLFEEGMDRMTGSNMGTWEHEWPDNTGLFSHGFKCQTEARDPGQKFRMCGIQQVDSSSLNTFPTSVLPKTRSPRCGLWVVTEESDLRHLSACARSKCGGLGQEAMCLSSSFC